MLNLSFGEKIISTDRPAFVMGIINATPDSFYEKSRGNLELAEQLISEGADILDIGGESTRPGFTQISSEEETERIIPLIRQIRQFSDIPISVDTRKSPVARAAFEAGADCLNDVSAMEDDEKIAEIVADYNKSVILMHRKPETKTDKVTDEKIVQTVKDYLKTRIDFALSKGISKEKILLDPGIGFGKNLEENALLIKNGGKLCDDFPVVMALSRKRCIGEMTGKAVEKRLYGTITADLVSVMNGAKILRVHDVEAAVDSLNVMKYLI